MFKWLSKIFGSAPTSAPLPPKPEATKETISERIVTTENLQARGRVTRTTTAQ